MPDQGLLRKILIFIEVPGQTTAAESTHNKTTNLIWIGEPYCFSNIVSLPLRKSSLAFIARLNVWYATPLTAFTASNYLNFECVTIPVVVSRICSAHQGQLNVFYPSVGQKTFSCPAIYILPGTTEERVANSNICLLSCSTIN